MKFGKISHIHRTIVTPEVYNQTQNPLLHIWVSGAQSDQRDLSRIVQKYICVSRTHGSCVDARVCRGVSCIGRNWMCSPCKLKLTLCGTKVKVIWMHATKLELFSCKGILEWWHAKRKRREEKRGLIKIFSHKPEV